MYFASWVLLLLVCWSKYFRALLRFSLNCGCRNFYIVTRRKERETKGGKEGRKDKEGRKEGKFSKFPSRRWLCDLSVSILHLSFCLNASLVFLSSDARLWISAGGFVSSSDWKSDRVKRHVCVCSVWSETISRSLCSSEAGAALHRRVCETS